MKPKARRTRPAAAVTALALGLLTLGGCASSGPAVNDGLDEAIRSRGLNPAKTLVPFQLTPEMEQWAREAVPERVPKEQKVDRLLDALTTMEGLNLEYKADFTGTAREVFESRTANCLSFTHLFVAMARSLDLDPYFLRIDEIETFAREGDLVIRAGHITAAAGPPTSPRFLEFSQVRDADYTRFTRISDLEAIALFYSNRGAEYLRQGRVSDAVWWLERAVVLAPNQPDAWVNLGVARRWEGNDDLAEASYRQALEINPDTSAAYHNLAALYRQQGDEEAVEELLALTDRRDNRNPFTYLQLGDLSLRQGDLEAAERFYKRALRLDSELATTHAALGLWAEASGKRREAHKRLEKALELDPYDSRASQLELMIDPVSAQARASLVASRAARGEGHHVADAAVTAGKHHKTVKAHGNAGAIRKTTYKSRQ